MKSLLPAYLFIVYILWIIMKYINGETGVFLLSFFVVFPIVSAIITLATRKNIKFEVKSPSIVSRGEEFDVELSFHSKKLALACIWLKVLNDNLEIAEQKTLCFTYVGKTKQTFTIKEKLEFSGLQTKEIRYFVLDLFQFPFLKKSFSKQFTIPVMYSLPEEKFYKPLQVINEQIQEEPDDTEVSLYNAKSITPGYENRKYEIGDPLKKINWKLSARTGELMTRLDEAINGVKIIFLIDFSNLIFKKNNDFFNQSISKANNEKLIETALGLLKNAVEAGFACKVMADETYEINTLNEAEEMATKLAYIPFADKRKDFDFESDKFTAIFLFSNNLDKMFVAEISQYLEQGKNIQTFGVQDIKLKDYYNIANQLNFKTA
ncbi:hypothetical protein FACS1894132_08940 [Clostridia bacterium]|nr:hypothetical protein FACS1894132_08940 [Clostridia bacterium]